MPDDRIASAASRLVAARRTGTRIAFGAGEGPQDYAEGFAVQDQVVAALGSPPMGWKVIEVPNGPVILAPLLQAGVVPPGGTWTIAGPEPAGIELEIAFRMGRDVPAGATGDQLLACVAGAHVIFELCESRLVDPAKQPRHVAVADCIANSGIVIGPEIPNWRRENLKARTGRLLVDGKVHAEGKSTDPVHALEVLAPAMAARGKKLASGQIVITGSLIGMNWLTGRHDLAGIIDGLGEVKMQVAAAG